MFFRSSLRLDRRGLSCREFFRKYQGSKKEEYKQELLEKLERTGYETVSDQVFRHASDTMTPQGIFVHRKNAGVPERGLVRRL